TPRCRSRSTKTSATRSSSRIATIVSWPLEETIISLVIANSSGLDMGRGLSAAGTRYRQSTANNPRPKAQLVRKSAHAHVEHEPETGECRNHRRSAVAHEWQRDPFNGRQPCRHGDVVDHLECEAGEHADHEVRTQPVLGQAGSLERAQNYEQIQAERGQDA